MRGLPAQLLLSRSLTEPGLGSSSCSSLPRPNQTLFLATSAVNRCQRVRKGCNKPLCATNPQGSILCPPQKSRPADGQPGGRGMGTGIPWKHQAWLPPCLQDASSSKQINNSINKNRWVRRRGRAPGPAWPIHLQPSLIGADLCSHFYHEHVQNKADI